MTRTNGQQNGGTKSHTNVVSPEIVYGFTKRRKEIAGGMIFLTIVYGIVYQIANHVTWLRPAEQFCPKDEPKCSRPDLFAFQFASGMMQLYMGMLGFWSWHWTKHGQNKYQTPEGRLFGYIEHAEWLMTGVFIFQAWDFIFSWFIAEHATAVFLTHHALAAATAYFALEYQLVHRYSIYYGGCSEISSIFLVLCDFDVFFPANRGSIWGAIIFFCQASFTISFLYYRVIGWWIECVPLWKDVWTVMKKNDNTNHQYADQYRPGKSWFLYIFLTMSILLGMLQVYWFAFGIVPKILEILND